MDNKVLFPYIVVMIAAAVTAAERFLPFAVFSGKVKVPKAVSYLGRVLPPAVMAMLVVFCLRDVSFSAASAWAPYLISAGVTTVVFIPTKKTLLSILAGTVCCMVLSQYVFI